MESTPQQKDRKFILKPSPSKYNSQQLRSDLNKEFELQQHTNATKNKKPRLPKKMNREPVTRKCDELNQQSAKFSATLPEPEDYNYRTLPARNYTDSVATRNTMHINEICSRSLSAFKSGKPGTIQRVVSNLNFAKTQNVFSGKIQKNRGS